MSILLTNAINVFFRIMYILIFVRVLMSWIPNARYSAIGNIIYTLTEPILGPVKRMMLDFSPVIALFILDIIQMILLYIVRMF